MYKYFSFLFDGITKNSKFIEFLLEKLDVLLQVFLSFSYPINDIVCQTNGQSLVFYI